MHKAEWASQSSFFFFFSKLHYIVFCFCGLFKAKGLALMSQLSLARMQSSRCLLKVRGKLLCFLIRCPYTFDAIVHWKRMFSWFGQMVSVSTGKASDCPPVIKLPLALGIHVSCECDFCIGMWTEPVSFCKVPHCLVFLRPARHLCTCTYTHICSAFSTCTRPACTFCEILWPVFNKEILFLMGKWLLLIWKASCGQYGPCLLKSCGVCKISSLLCTCQ